MPRKMSRQHHMRLAGPAIYAAMAAATAEAQARFGSQRRALMEEMAPLTVSQSDNALSAAEEVRLMALRAQYDAVIIEQKWFAEAVLALWLGDDGAMAAA